MGDGSSSLTIRNVMSIGHSPDIYKYTMTTGDSVAPIAQTYGEKDLGGCFFLFFFV